jgi:hypothetical protein
MTFLMPCPQAPRDPPSRASLPRWSPQSPWREPRPARHRARYSWRETMKAQAVGRCPSSIATQYWVTSLRSQYHCSTTRPSNSAAGHAGVRPDERAAQQADSHRGGGAPGRRWLSPGLPRFAAGHRWRSTPELLRYWLVSFNLIPEHRPGYLVQALTSRYERHAGLQPGTGRP